MNAYIICSMGGAIAVHTAERNLIPSLAGLIVIDVVEGEKHIESAHKIMVLIA